MSEPKTLGESLEDIDPSLVDEPIPFEMGDDPAEVGIIEDGDDL